MEVLATGSSQAARISAMEPRNLEGDFFIRRCSPNFGFCKFYYKIRVVLGFRRNRDIESRAVMGS